jgi:choline kinase
MHIHVLYNFSLIPPLSTAVSIQAPTDARPIQLSAPYDEKDFQRPALRRQHSAKRLKGRSPADILKIPTVRQDHLDQGRPLDEPQEVGVPQAPPGEEQQQHQHHHHHHHHHHQTGATREYEAIKNVIEEVWNWLEEEKAKLFRQRALRPKGSGEAEADRASQSTDGPDSRFALEKLEQILSAASASHNVLRPARGSHEPGSRRRSSTLSRRARKLSSSDTDFVDGDPVVPHIEAILDNSKTMNYAGGSAGSNRDLTRISSRAVKEREAWAVFKQDIVRLTHTLKLKGWRRVPLESGAEVEVVRLSGALTNAVYVVSPPKHLPQSPPAAGSPPLPPKKPPQYALSPSGSGRTPRLTT